eukprot:2698-Heterococcus_DN1.PRE.5
MLGRGKRGSKTSNEPTNAQPLRNTSQVPGAQCAYNAHTTDVVHVRSNVHRQTKADEKNVHTF